MTRRLVKLKKSAKEVVLLKPNTEIEVKKSEPQVQQQIERTIKPIQKTNEIRNVSLEEGILIGPQAFDPGVEKLNELKGDVELIQGTNITINKDTTTKRLTINSKDSGVLKFNNYTGNINVLGASPISVDDKGNGNFEIKDTASRVKSIKCNSDTLINDVIISGTNDITVSKTNNVNGLTIGLSTSYKPIKTLNGYVPDNNQNFTFLEGNNISISATNGEITIGMKGNPQIVDFSPLSEISSITDISSASTVKKLREAVNSIVQLLTNFYNTNT